ncbi:arylacetamide deacetylase-like isoform X2 [Styela clava]
MGRKLVAGLVFAVCFAYFLYIPYPDQCDFPILVKVFYSLLKVLDFAGGVSVWFGGRYSTPYKLTDYNLAKSSDVMTTIAMFDGVEVAIYHPKEFAKNRPGSAMIYFHGGGFTIGSIASYASVTMKIAEKTGMLVIVPEYRLAPDHPFPAGFDDCLRVTKHFIERAHDFDVDPNKIVLSGDSADLKTRPTLFR